MRNRPLVTTIPKLLAARAYFKAHPEDKVPVTDHAFPEIYWNQADFIAWFLECLHGYINHKDPRNPWRQMDDEYHIHLQRDARTINDYYGKRIRHTGCQGLLHTKEMQRRYPHINNQPREF